MKAVWYYQTKDFKFHTLEKVKRIEEIADSENKMKIFFDDKICLGCQLKKDFIEILFGEKQVRVSIDGKDDFIDYTSYSDLVTIFNKNYSKIFDAQKCKHIEKSIIDILNMVGILKNNAMEAVMIPFEKYEYLSALEDIFEKMEISETVKNRMKNYDASKSVSWDSIREE